MSTSTIFHLDCTQLDISVDTVIRRLRELEIIPHIPARKAFLLPNEMQKRLTYAIDYGHHTAEWWKTRTVFSDESTIGYADFFPVIFPINTHPKTHIITHFVVIKILVLYNEMLFRIYNSRLINLNGPFILQD